MKIFFMARKRQRRQERARDNTQKVGSRIKKRRRVILALLCISCDGAEGFRQMELRCPLREPFVPLGNRRCEESAIPKKVLPRHERVRIRRIIP
ncbi:hypothetical protein NDU88_002940 [Pleurodeles waltl]|uniref:Uncharacterized protein n=1 Tax=Pleurodeles waltl TaxID=8319 RepID=A0AAV7TMN4_PLEWA|nr:hypothetical protein NDU88_002940 [Pleurodeles waltl]